MTLGIGDLALFAGALFVLFLTPGPVWVALVARAMSGGFHAAWPLALGVVIGDVLWCLLAILGVSWIVSVYGDFLELLKWVACFVFIALGIALLRNSGKTIASDSRLTRPGMWAGFVAGLMVILANPKAILFYMGMLPGFFDLAAMTTLDVVAVCALAALVPFFGNLILAGSIGRVRAVLQSPAALRRMNVTAGCLLILVGVIIPWV